MHDALSAGELNGNGDTYLVHNSYWGVRVTADTMQRAVRQRPQQGVPTCAAGPKVSSIVLVATFSTQREVKPINTQFEEPTPSITFCLGRKKTTWYPWYPCNRSTCLYRMLIELLIIQEKSECW